MKVLMRLIGAIVMLSILCCFCAPALAQQASLELSASPDIILADGSSSTAITAVAIGSGGGSVPDGTQIRFSTTKGTLSAQAVASASGIARVTLTSDPLPGTAVVSVNFINGHDAANGQLSVQFTVDKSLANSNTADQGWLSVSSTKYLAYSADSKTIDASGSKQGVHLSYQGLSIEADALQVDLGTGYVRARNAVLQHGRSATVHAQIAAYNLNSMQGDAILADEPGQSGRTVANVALSGADLEFKPLTQEQAGQVGQGSTYTFVDISDSRVLVTAAAVSVKMNDRIQFRRASVYVQGKKIVSLPYHVMPLSTGQIFGQQLLGYGTNGLFLDVPYYLSLSPHGTGTLSLRSLAASEQNGTYYYGRSGMALDFDQKYNDPQGDGVGDFQVLGLSRSDFGLRWNQTQRISSSARGYFNIDSPQHNGVFASSNITQQLKGMSLNFNGSINTAPTLAGISTDSNSLSTYLASDAHTLFGTRCMARIMPRCFHCRPRTPKRRIRTSPRRRSPVPRET